ncbi:hypothetical protein [Ruminococcus sp. 5_1_39BFAA]|uniref:hypothetical protein n=1 Tax=Ruminococcus sp. 5_1_39BFAA TaxID=457412 RepID=UPI0035670B75
MTPKLDKNTLEYLERIGIENFSSAENIILGLFDKISDPDNEKITSKLIVEMTGWHIRYTADEINNDIFNPCSERYKSATFDAWKILEILSDNKFDSYIKEIIHDLITEKNRAYEKVYYKIQDDSSMWQEEIRKHTDNVALNYCMDELTSYDVEKLKEHVLKRCIQ